MFEIKKFVKDLKTVFDKKQKKKKERNRLIKTLTVFFAFLIIFIFIATPVLAYQVIYQNKIYPGVYIDGINLGGLTQSEAIIHLNQAVDNLKLRGLNFHYQNKNAKIEMTTLSPTDPDLAYQVLNFDVETLVARAYSFGRNQDFLTNLADQLKAILTQKKINLAYTLNEKELKNSLQDEFSSWERPAMNAKIIFGENEQISIQNETNGFVIDYDQAVSDLKNNINLIAINTVDLRTKPALAEVTRDEALRNIGLVNDILKQEKIVLKYEDKEWPIERTEFEKWLDFAKENNKIILTFDNDLLNKKLENLALEIDQPALDAKFSFADGKVIDFQPSEPGLALDLDASNEKIKNDFFHDKKIDIELAVKESEPKVKTGDVNDLGIKELLGVGVSDFAGSHTNRIKNIKNAVDHLNGLIISPGEFSIVDAIGDVTAATGYYPEYVIKGDRTIPEYGGGLCQIGTTIFRAALYSGLPVTERKPHSYIVSYYKPIGMDATIYGPHPDLRFVNDTGHNILLKITIEGTILRFEFWGTSDGRKVEITDPEIYNWSSQPADRLIENPNLKPGEKRLMEQGRRGADTHFYRYLTLANGEKKEEIWRSHYVAWPNIYEIGVEPKSEETPADNTNSEADNSDASSAGQSGTSDNQNINSN